MISAIKSTSSATLVREVDVVARVREPLRERVQLAPSTSFVENILKNLMPMTDPQQLRVRASSFFFIEKKPLNLSLSLLKATRITIVIFAALVLLYAISMRGSSIYNLVSSAYQARAARRRPNDEAAAAHSGG